MQRTQKRITVTIRPPGGRQRAHGIPCGLTSTRGHCAAGEPVRWNAAERSSPLSAVAGGCDDLDAA